MTWLGTIGIMSTMFEMSLSRSLSTGIRASWLADGLRSSRLLSTRDQSKFRSFDSVKSKSWHAKLNANSSLKPLMISTIKGRKSPDISLSAITLSTFSSTSPALPILCVIHAGNPLLEVQKVEW